MYFISTILLFYLGREDTYIRSEQIRRMHQGGHTVRLIHIVICDQDVAEGHAEVGQDLAEAIGDENGIGGGDAGGAVVGSGV